MEQIWGFLVKFQVRRPVSRVLFLTKSVSKNGESRGGGHSSGAVVTQLPRCDLPRRRPEDGACVLSLGSGCGRLYLVLLPVGFAVPRLLPASRWALTATLSPLPGYEPGRFAFCGTFPEVALAGR